MEITSLKQKSADLLAKLNLVAVICLFALSCAAQSVWEASEVKAGKTVFMCAKHGERYSIKNSNYVDPRETRSQYDINRLDFSYVSLISHDPFLEAFKEAFTASRITQLAQSNDVVDIFFNVDEKGQILGVSFSLHEETTILPEELAILEQELLSRVQFVVIGKKVEDLIFHSAPFRVYFSEVQNGEIRQVRNSVNLKSRY